MANLHPRKENQFKPGVSGNPKGRPPVFSLTEMIRRKLQEIPPEYAKDKKSYAELLVTSMLHKGIVEKDHSTQKLIINYMEGLPVARLANADGSNLAPQPIMDVLQDSSNKKNISANKEN